MKSRLSSTICNCRGTPLQKSDNETTQPHFLRSLAGDLTLNEATFICRSSLESTPSPDVRQNFGILCIAMLSFTASPFDPLSLTLAGRGREALKLSVQPMVANHANSCGLSQILCLGLGPLIHPMIRPLKFIVVADRSSNISTSLRPLEFSLRYQTGIRSDIRRLKNVCS